MNLRKSLLLLKSINPLLFLVFLHGHVLPSRGATLRGAGRWIMLSLSKQQGMLRCELRCAGVPGRVILCSHDCVWTTSHTLLDFCMPSRALLQLSISTQCTFVEFKESGACSWQEGRPSSAPAPPTPLSSRYLCGTLILNPHPQGLCLLITLLSK